MNLLLLALKYRKQAVYALLAVAVAWALLEYRHSLIAAGRAQGAATVRARWDADKAAIQALADKAVADARAKESAALQNIVEVIRDANEKLVSIAADRDGLRGRLLAARQATAGRCSLPEAPGASGVAATAPDGGDGSLDAAIADAITESLGNNVRHAALIEVIRPQL